MHIHVYIHTYVQIRTNTVYILNETVHIHIHHGCIHAQNDNVHTRCGMNINITYTCIHTYVLAQHAHTYSIE